MAWLRSKMKRSARKKEEVEPKSPPIFPMSAERELMRFSNRYMSVYGDAVAERMPRIASEYEKARRSRREDDWATFLTLLYFYLTEAESAAAEYAMTEEFQNGIDKIGKQIERATITGWEKSVKSALGVDIDKSYYEGDFCRDKVQEFVDSCSGDLKEGPKYASEDIENRFQQGYEENTPVNDMKEEIQERYEVNKDKTRNIVRSRVGDLHAGITEKIDHDAGVNEYIWRTCLDDRVRPCHAALEGTRHSFNDPPEMWYETKSMGIIYTGRRCNPGEDYNCRCVAVPVFRTDNVNLPVRGV